MINPKIFIWFRKALKWELIIICASFAYIMPFQSAHAWSDANSNTTWSGCYIVVDISFDTFCSDYRDPPNSSWESFSGGRCGHKDNSSAVSKYPDGCMMTTQATYDAAYSSSGGDLPEDWFDKNGQPKPGSPSISQPPDIESCTLTSFPINTGPKGNRTFPGLSDTWTDSDGCQYSIDPDSGDAGEIILGCDSYPDSPKPDDIWCVYKTKPVGTVPPPTEENPDAPPTPPETQESGEPTPIQEDTKDDLIVDWESWEPNPPHQDEFIDPDKVVTITLPDGGTVDVTIAPDGKISIDYGDYSPNDVPIIAGPNGYPQPNPGYSRPGGGSPGGSGPSGGSPDGPSNPPGIGGGGDGGGGDGSGDGDGNGSGSCGILPDIICEWIKPGELPSDPDVPFIDTEEKTYNSSIATNVSCPAPVSFTVPMLSRTYELSYEYACQLAEAINPFVLLSAYLMSGYILIGAIRG